MPADQGSLYGKPRTKKDNNEQTASNLAFTSQLSSLIAQSATNAPSQGRQRPSKNPKSDIFAKHNKGTQKRAAADLLDDNRALKQVHRSTQDIGSVDTATLGRSRRRMEEKVRMYDDMKKGLYLTGDSDDDDDNAPIDPSDPEAYLKRLRRKEKEGLVDFDLKDTNEQEFKPDDSDEDTSSVISYEDEFGRSRRGTRAEAAEASRAKDEAAGGESAQERWRPARPDNLIYGEAVQTEAFNPDADVASKMSHLAARRDRSPTPPENKHYNAEEEVRNRGTGFYTFSADEEERKKQMEQLEIMRKLTVSKRLSAQEEIAQRKAKKEARIQDCIDFFARRKALQEAAQRERELNPPPPIDPSDMPDPELDFLPLEHQRPSWVPWFVRNPRRLFEPVPWKLAEEKPSEPSEPGEAGSEQPR
ncbi:unnamed protein product [Penicillium salamii]|uniref:Uncharacterized protein n=1 Tax=Penicillium salamii TaxID=1612424 RepID=A0A9W4JSH0_9EURO|nr:unnamed protein product [Penicillium salamii]CAG8161757.1 unnamed protein product [Penicillium salamii]CAG8161803.1 unnamed protein product [Penicillium salamii]CAG8166816.1 unnamed protein product [Penicillium salamii]CAG8234966.1 unnamed protein product [Penicillium salamii]